MTKTFCDRCGVEQGHDRFSRVSLVENYDNVAASAVMIKKLEACDLCDHCLQTVRDTMGPLPNAVRVSV